RYEVITGDDQSQLLLDIPRYDFNWQLLYRYAEPLTLRRGQTLRFTAWFDNSANNPANPDPTKTVRWGPQTFDEMHLGYVEYIVPGLPPGSPTATGGRLASATQPRSSLLRRLDTDGDGSVSEEELKQAAQRSDAFKDKPRLV